MEGVSDIQQQQQAEGVQCMEGVSDIQQQQQAEGVPVAQRSSWSSFLKSLRTCLLFF